MTRRAGDTDGDESDERLALRRRTLTRIAATAGAGVVVGWSFSGITGAAETNEVSITMNITPVGERVLVQTVESDDRTVSGVATRGNTDDASQEGIVRAAGDTDPVSEGDKILFEGSSGSEVVIAGEEHLILDDEVILAVIED